MKLASIVDIKFCWLFVRNGRITFENKCLITGRFLSFNEVTVRTYLVLKCNQIPLAQLTCMCVTRPFKGASLPDYFNVSMPLTYEEHEKLTFAIHFCMCATRPFISMQRGWPIRERKRERERKVVN